MITLTKVDSVEGGQNKRIVEVDVQPHDLVFANVSYFDGGSPYITPSIASVEEIGKSQIRASEGQYTGDVIGIVWKVLTGTLLSVEIGANDNYNDDLYVVVFRPSEPTVDVNAYIRTKISQDKIWTDVLDVIAGEYILCGQYSSDHVSDVRETPQSNDKGGTAVVEVADWALPEGAASPTNSFMEILKVTAPGTFKYYGPNPTVMRVTVQGDPALAIWVFSHFMGV